LLTSTDPAGGVTRYAYDAKDRLTSVRDPINLTTSYTYDGLGNLLKEEQANRLTMRFEYDGIRYQGYAGDTLASALLANGVHLVARSFKYNLLHAEPLR
jgi:YD repeat-containing protein